MRLTSASLEQDLSQIHSRILNFIKEYVKNAHAKGIVLGLSGGVDSATVAALCSQAIGGQNVLALLIPEEETFKQKDIDDANVIAKMYGIKTQLCDMTSALEGIYKNIPAYEPRDKLCKGNIKARTRMIYLYYYANQQSLIVCGTSDKSETMMGYFTKWGDAAADIAPIMDLYKTQVRKLAIHIGIPREVALKPSTPSLWPDQSAESDLGIKYETLDIILLGLERFMKAKEIAEQLDLDEAIIDKIKTRWLLNEHKRIMPPSLKLGFRTVGNDFRLPKHAY